MTLRRCGLALSLCFLALIGCSEKKPPEPPKPVETPKPIEAAKPTPPPTADEPHPAGFVRFVAEQVRPLLG